MNLLIKKGWLVTPTDVFKSDLLVKQGKIVQIGQDIAIEGSQAIDAEGKYVLPGCIDSHCHFSLPVSGTVTADDFATGTKAAACGGVTTILDFALQKKDQTLMDAVKQRRQEADGRVAVDYSLHIEVNNFSSRILDEIPVVVKQEGIPSLKVFMVERKDGVMADDGLFYAVLERVAGCGGIVCVHAENSFIIRYLASKFLQEGKTETIYHARSHPDFSEAEAISRAIWLARETGALLNIFHLSTKEGMEVIQTARNDKFNIYVETCPQYLLLTEDKFLGDNGVNYALCPPLRTKEDQERLWQGLINGQIQTVSTDHCSFTAKQKSAGRECFTKIPLGLPGVETLLPLLYHFGVNKKRFNVNRLVQLLCHNPAKIFGLYPEKGSLVIGTDADLVVFDPLREVEIKAENLHMNTDYSPYEGIIVTGYPLMTILRGKVIYRDGVYAGSAGDGQFLKRKLMAAT